MLTYHHHTNRCYTNPHQQDIIMRMYISMLYIIQNAYNNWRQRDSNFSRIRTFPNWSRLNKKYKPLLLISNSFRNSSKCRPNLSWHKGPKWSSKNNFLSKEIKPLVGGLVTQGHKRKDLKSNKSKNLKY